MYPKYYTSTLTNDLAKNMFEHSWMKSRGIIGDLPTRNPNLD